MKEIWEPVKGFKGYYEVSNQGRVRSLSRMQKRGSLIYPLVGRILLAQIHKTHNYWSVLLSVDGKVKNAKVHRLVAEAFIPNPRKKPQVNHLDGNRLNNILSNLEWATPAENIQHAWRTGLMVCSDQQGEKNGNARLTSKDIQAIRRLSLKNTRANLARKYKVHRSQISRILTGSRWSSLAA